MPLSWNDIRAKAITFSKEWEDECSEDAEAKIFWEQFFAVFGITRRRIASFEVPVKKSDGKGGFIDLLWKSKLLVEHKSRGKNLDRAYRQATDYFHGLTEKDLPQYVLVSDFARFRLYNLDDGTTTEFALQDLHENIGLFGFIAGYQTTSYAKEDSVNIEAAERLGKLHDLLKESGYVDYPLEVLLVRMLFCLFADDTGIFNKSQFQTYIQNRTSEDGADLGMHLAQLFQILNTADSKRQASLDVQLAEFPYVDGRLFEEVLPLASFDRKMRDTLLYCCALDWSKISPAIFGSLFQSIMDKDARRNLGAHYTREQNILKALRPLFLDALWKEFGRVKSDRRRLGDFHQKLRSIRVLDPACGCGNFLVIAYRELRKLELEVLRELYKGQGTRMLDISLAILLDVDQFYGIEIEEFPAQIAQVALWLTDHQMNMLVSKEFGQYFKRLPLKKAPNIVRGNALTVDWRSVVSPELLSYIVGNPPFVGKQYQAPEQKQELAAIFHDIPGAGVLDYVACWYRKAAEYMAGNPKIRGAFVSTNSITQGEQVGVLWTDLFQRGVKINFAHRTFQWSSEARGKAAVHCVIIGFALEDTSEKLLFDYDTPKSDPHALSVKNINPYLVEGGDIAVSNIRKPLCAVPPCIFGSMPNDGGHLLLSSAERKTLLAEEPGVEQWIRRYVGSEEFINGIERWCLWLVGIPPEVIRRLPMTLTRVDSVRKTRLASKRPTTRALAKNPSLFGEMRQPVSEYLLIPSVSSERRPYIPVGFLDKDVIANNLVFVVPNATTYHLGVLSSVMHMAWVRAVCGRLKSDYRYSSGIVYNNFPWPTPSEKQHQAIEEAGQGVLDARAHHPTATLADLYDPLTMPADLLKAHQKLDKAVDMAYGVKGFDSEAKRVAYLFERYETLVAPLAITTSIKKRKKSA